MSPILPLNVSMRYLARARKGWMHALGARGGGCIRIMHGRDH